MNIKMCFFVRGGAGVSTGEDGVGAGAAAAAAAAAEDDDDDDDDYADDG